MNYPENDYRNYLSHHGIKGQKWGVRRFQNEDGTLTDLGKKRYYDDHREEIRSILSRSANDFNSSSESRRLSADVNKAYKALNKYIDETSKLEDKMYEAFLMGGSNSRQYLDLKKSVENRAASERDLHKAYRDAIKKLDDSYKNYRIKELDSMTNDRSLSEFLYEENHKDNYMRR